MELFELAITSKIYWTNRIFSGQTEYDTMKKMSILVFEILEMAWATRQCALIDMKVEFGVDSRG